jgi:hypothetical protein
LLLVYRDRLGLLGVLMMMALVLLLKA